MLPFCTVFLVLACLALGPLAPSAKAQPQKGYDCAVTETIEGEPPPDPNASPFGFGSYHVNEDRSMWLASRPWRASKSDKGIWIRPQGTQLQVVGRRLDAEAPPLYVRIPEGYMTGFHVTSMTFPTEGCWEVRATAGEKELRFVVTVAPAEDSSAATP